MKNKETKIRQFVIYKCGDYAVRGFIVGLAFTSMIYQLLNLIFK